MMRFFWITVITVAAITLISGCGTQNAHSKSSEPVQNSQTPIPGTEQKFEESGNGSDSAEPERTGAVEIMDAAFYRGTIQEIKEIEGTKVFTLLGAPGAGFGPAITIAFGDSPQVEFDPAQLKAGDQVEVYYGVPADGKKLAYYKGISAVKLFEEAATNYNGVVVEVRPGEKAGEGQLVMRHLDAPESKDPQIQAQNEIVFNYGKQTRWCRGLSAESVKPGDRLNIYHRGIATMSLPPQGISLEIRPMAEDDRLSSESR